LTDRETILERRLQRERAARKQAENLLESKSGELFETNQKLERLNKKLEGIVQRRTQTLNTLIKNLNSGILLEDENRDILLTNPLLHKIFKLPVSEVEIIGKNCADSLLRVADQFKDADEFIETTHEAIEKQKDIYSQTLEMNNGNVLLRDAIRIQKDGEFFGTLWQYQDKTKEIRAQQRIKESEEKYRGIIENMQLGLLEVDQEHRVTRAYESFCKMVGYTEEELFGQYAKELLLAEEYHALMDYEEQKRSSGDQSVYEIQLKRKDGSKIWALLSGAPLYNRDGEITGSIGIHYDITDRKALEEELIQARDEAQRARQIEKQFLANMSHEIRNPINAIVGFTNLLYDSEPTEEQLTNLNNIKYASDILLGLISGILDLSKIESGNYELVEKPVNLQEVLNALVQITTFKVQGKPVEIKHTVDNAIDFPILADPTVLNQIFLNLLTNASKFTKEGEIEVSARLVDQSDEKATIRFEVADTGIGISEDAVSEIFESFRQANNETKLMYGGTGLGLSIVRNLVRNYGGDISVDSEPGKGTSFTFELSFLKLKKESKSRAKLDVQSVEGKNVLIVEDNELNQQYLSGQMKKWGLAHDIASNGEEALQHVETTGYDLVLMDIRMPVMDGYESTIRIRALGHNDNCNVPIVALTASSQIDEKEKALSTGMNLHLTKPLTAEKLAKTLVKFNILEAKQGETREEFHFSEKLDHEYLSEFYQGDLDRAKMMFGIFLKIMDQEIESLKSYYQAEDWSAFGNKAHKICPNFAMVGFRSLTKTVEGYEKARRNDKIIPKIKESFDTFLQEFDNAKAIVYHEIERINVFQQNEMHNS